MPEKELSFNLSFWRRRRRPRLNGISPLSQLKLRSSVCRNERFPMAGESAPVSPLPFNLSATTCAGLPWLHVTPSQLQKSALLFQEASAGAPPLLSCPLKASKAASSPACTLATAWMVASNHSKLMTPIAMSFLVWLSEMAVGCSIYILLVNHVKKMLLGQSLKVQDLFMCAVLAVAMTLIRSSACRVIVKKMASVIQWLRLGRFGRQVDRTFGNESSWSYCMSCHHPSSDFDPHFAFRFCSGAECAVVSVQSNHCVAAYDSRRNLDGSLLFLL